MINHGTILIAKDDWAIADVLAEMLTDEGYSVQTVANGCEVLAALQGEPPDLALIDLSLPGMSGWEVLSAMRAHQIDVPVMIDHDREHPGG